MGLMTANIALHLAEVAIAAVFGNHRDNKTGQNRPGIVRYCGGSDGPVASAGAV
jgi:hypothetical protein